MFWVLCAQVKKNFKCIKYEKTFNHFKSLTRHMKGSHEATKSINCKLIMTKLCLTATNVIKIP